MVHSIVIIGDINGRISEVFAKLAKLHKKKNFTLAIIPGSLFADGDDGLNQRELDSLVNGSTAVPLPVYFLLSRTALPEAAANIINEKDGVLVKNLSCFGTNYRFVTEEGISIVALGGTRQEVQSASPWEGGYTDEEAAAFLSHRGADLLITSEWPEGITTGSKQPQSGDTPPERSIIAKLCATLQPRWHFSASSTHYAREPFHHGPNFPDKVTNFMSLAPFTPDTKDWIFAFNLNTQALPVLPAGTTALPFKSKRPLASQEQSFRFANGNDVSHDRHRSKRRKTKGPVSKQDCYFCLSSPACEEHMICSTGDNAYLTIAKGPLLKRDTYPALNMPGHMLIIPHEHIPMLDTSADDPTQREMEVWRRRLHDWVASRSKDADGKATLGTLTWEISRAGNVHHHWQLVPVPSQMILAGTVERAFETAANDQGYPEFQRKQVEGGNFFKIMVLDEGVHRQRSMSIDDFPQFDLQFGRRVLGQVLGLESRTNWRDCPQTKDEEKEDVARFRETFGSFEDVTYDE